jgi:hypothetical protein
MLAAQASAQDPGSLVPVALVVITGAVIFWRILIKAVAIGLILLAVLGLVELLQSFH